MPPETSTVPTETPAPAAPEQVQAPVSADAGGDSFQVDESVFSKLPPEARQVVDPVLKGFREKASQALQKERDNFKPHVEKATAWDKLVADKEFQRWWIERTNPRSSQHAQTQAPTAPQQPPVSNEEWAVAVEKANAGDTTALTALQEKIMDAHVKAKYAPVIDQLTLKQREMELSMELNELFTSHTDAKDMDKAGVLEPFLHYYTDKLGKPMEIAYQEAKKAWEQISSSAKKAALGMVQEKKAAVTETPSTTTQDESVIYVNDAREMLRSQLQANMRGQKVTYMVRPRQK